MKNFKLIGLLTILHLTLSPSERYPNWQPHEWLKNWQPGQNQGPNQEYSDEYLMKMKENLLKEDLITSLQDQLLLAISTNNPNLIRDLINAGAYPNYKDNDGNTMLHIAAELNANEDMIKVLIDNGASLFIENKKGQLPFEIDNINEHTFYGFKEALMDLVSSELKPNQHLMEHEIFRRFQAIRNSRFD